MARDFLFLVPLIFAVALLYIGYLVGASSGKRKSVKAHKEALKLVQATRELVSTDPAGTMFGPTRDRTQFVLDTYESRVREL